MAESSIHLVTVQRNVDLMVLVSRRGMVVEGDIRRVHFEVNSDGTVQ